MTSAPRPSADPGPGLALALIALATLTCGPATAGSVAGPRIEFLRHGLFCAPPEAGRVPAPDTISGWTHVPDEPIEILVETLTAPAVLGLGMGVEFLLFGDDPVELRYEVTHPPMAPTGATRQSWGPEGAVAWGAGSMFFQFDVADELVTGDWTFRALDGAEELLRVTFTVVDPGAAPDLARLCRDGVLLSTLR